MIIPFTISFFTKTSCILVASLVFLTGKMSKFDGTKGPPDINGMVSLKVDNLTYRTTMDELEK